VGNVKVPVKFLIDGKVIFEVYRICKDKNISIGEYIETLLKQALKKS
jgi:hypothetical protein